MDLLGAAGVVIEARSAVLPPIVLGGAPGSTLGASGGSSGGGSGPSLLLRWLRPDVRVTAGGAELVHYKPGGDAPAVPWLGMVGVAVVVGGLLWAGWALGRMAR